jgi:ATP-dependent helicase/nuclease subunit B
MQILENAADAHAAHHDPEWGIADVVSAVRRWVGDETFVQHGARAGVRLLDDQAARYGEFDDVTIVGLVESEWPDRTRRNIFYPPTLLKALNWPSEKDRRAGADARFLDLLASATGRVELSTFLLDDEAIVSRSIQLDEVPRARLTTVTRVLPGEPLIGGETIALGEPDADSIPQPAHDWYAMRRDRTPADAPAFHGSAGVLPARTWSVSALETYIGCPFKFFAQHVLRLEEEPDDEEVMDPRRQGQFVHEVFESFFHEWQAAGHRAITPALLPLARELFTGVVDRALQQLPEGEAALERTRLLGSPAAAGLGEAVFRMEAERPVPVVERLLERKLDGLFTMHAGDGPRLVSLRGKADRIDLLGDGTFRLIDYKLGWPPDRNKALQLPIYALCAEQQLTAQNRRWVLGEAMYLAFKGPKRVVPLFTTPAARADVLARAQQRLVDTLDAIERGEFPPAPDDVYRCETCSFAAVCRKDYVGEV